MSASREETEPQFCCGVSRGEKLEIVCKPGLYSRITLTIGRGAGGRAGGRTGAAAFFGLLCAIPHSTKNPIYSKSARETGISMPNLMRVEPRNIGEWLFVAIVGLATSLMCVFYAIRYVQSIITTTTTSHTHHILSCCTGESCPCIPKRRYLIVISKMRALCQLKIDCGEDGG